MYYTFIRPSSTLASPRHLRLISADVLPDLDEALRVEEHFVGFITINLDLSSQVPLKTDEKELRWKDIDTKARQLCSEPGKKYILILFLYLIFSALGQTSRL